MATRVAPEEVVATDLAPARIAPPAPKASESTPKVQPAPAEDYFPSHFPEPSGEASEQPSTF
jgi:hypothetical protein